MSGSANPAGEYRKITAASTNMHITGREKTLLTQPAREVLVAAEAVSDDELNVSGTANSGVVQATAKSLRRLSGRLYVRRTALILPFQRSKSIAA
jgi:hypothetical protein